MLGKLIMLLQRDYSFVDVRISQVMTAFETIAVRNENAHCLLKIWFLFFFFLGLHLTWRIEGTNLKLSYMSMGLGLEQGSK